MSLKKLFAIVLSAVLLCGAVGCLAEGTIDYNGRTKLAMFAPLTGDNLQYGVKIRDGAQLAVDQFNAEHGTEFTLEVYDDKGDPNEAVNIANMIVSDKDEVVAALAGYGSS